MANTQEIEEIKIKSANSIVFLTLRNAGIQAISVIGFFLLTIILSPADVGLFAIVVAVTSILNYFSDVGLSPALIQKKAPPTDSELQTSFTIQQFLVITSIIIIGLIYPQIARSHNFGSKEMWIFISLCYAFLISSLKTIPSVLLERELNFKKISTVDIIENILFYTIAVVAAYSGLGAYSYALATFIRATVGLIIMYRLKGWKIGIGFSLQAVKHLFKFGIPYQLNSLIALAKDDLSDLMVAGIIGRTGFGLLSWAQKAPRMPLSLMDTFMRVTFPAFSRFQDDIPLLKKTIERSIYFIALIIYPSLVGIAFLAPDIIHLVPKYNKWEPALIPLYFYAASFMIAAVTTPLTNAFNAVGKILTTTKMMIVWTVLTWIFYPILSLKYGYIGTSVASLIVGLSSFIVWYLAYKHFRINLVANLINPIISTALIALVLLGINHLGLTLITSIITKIISALCIYIAYHLIFSKDEINWFINQLRWLKAKR